MRKKRDLCGGEGSVNKGIPEVLMEYEACRDFFQNMTSVGEICDFSFTGFDSICSQTHM